MSLPPRATPADRELSAPPSRSRRRSRVPAGRAAPRRAARAGCAARVRRRRRPGRSRGRASGEPVLRHARRRRSVPPGCPPRRGPSRRSGRSPPRARAARHHPGVRPALGVVAFEAVHRACAAKAPSMGAVVKDGRNGKFVRSTFVLQPGDPQRDVEPTAVRPQSGSAVPGNTLGTPWYANRDGPPNTNRSPDCSSTSVYGLVRGYRGCRSGRCSVADAQRHHRGVRPLLLVAVHAHAGGVVVEVDQRGVRLVGGTRSRIVVGVGDGTSSQLRQPLRHRQHPPATRVAGDPACSGTAASASPGTRSAPTCVPGGQARGRIGTGPRAQSRHASTSRRLLTQVEPVGDQHRTVRDGAAGPRQQGRIYRPPSRAISSIRRTRLVGTPRTAGSRRRRRCPSSAKEHALCHVAAAGDGAGRARTVERAVDAVLAVTAESAGVALS